MNPLRLGWRKPRYPHFHENTTQLFHDKGHRYAKFAQCTQRYPSGDGIAYGAPATVALLQIVRRHTVPVF